MDRKHISTTEEREKELERVKKETEEWNKNWYRSFIIEDNKRLMREIEERKKAAEKIPPEERPGYAFNKWVEEAHVRGEILDPFIKQHLEAKITAARWALALAMGMTLLFKGFWVLWIVFILLYNWEVKRLKKEALEAYLKRGKRK